MALEECFGHGRGETKTGVGLIRADIVEVQPWTPAHIILDAGGHPIPVPQPGPHGRAPRVDKTAPCRMRFHPSLVRRRKVRIAPQGDGTSGKKRKIGRNIVPLDRKSTRLNSSHLVISYAV